MLERMKKMLKKEKGFTLVELLAVIVILGIVLAIAIPSISGVISKAEEDADGSNKDLFENAARMADTMELEPKSDSNDEYYTLADLVDEGFLEEIPEKPGTKEEYGKEKKVYVEENDSGKGKKFVYEDRKE